MMRRRLEDTKARDDMEDCDVAGSQLTVLPQSSPWRVEWTGVECALLEWSLERSGQNYYGDYAVRRRTGSTVTSNHLIPPDTT